MAHLLQPYLQLLDLPRQGQGVHQNTTSLKSISRIYCVEMVVDIMGMKSRMVSAQFATRSTREINRQSRASRSHPAEKNRLVQVQGLGPLLLVFKTSLEDPAFLPLLHCPRLLLLNCKFEFCNHVISVIASTLP